ncbi:MAG TPA: NuoF family protein [Deinococcales bacterium]|nr:NuoF family protein [Deinococcales bacterium]
MTPEELSRIAGEVRVDPPEGETQLRVCVSSGCVSSEADVLLKRLEAEVKSHGVEKRCKVKGVGCVGLCSEGPNVTVVNGEEQDFLARVAPEDAPEIAARAATNTVPERLVLRSDTPFFLRQHKVALENCGRIDPGKIEEAVAVGGYQGLLKALNNYTRQGVVNEVTRSGLRGRGGAGYPSGLKWATVAKSAGERKFVVCNGDEGDPGAYMDRSVLESDPHRVLEGMAIAAYAVGASEGFVYVRAEYPLAVQRLRSAIRQAERQNLLGQNIMGTPFSFKVEIRLGAGAFVCGEETALIASIEGRRGIPSPRPPYPAESGLWGCPTLINNVETFANVAPILRHGGEKFASVGHGRSRGTKVFALTGRVRNVGLIEVPMGTTLREIIFEIGGGIPEPPPGPDGKVRPAKFKAAQTGGPSGGCLPEQYLDTPVDYESLTAAGSMMGSGGLIVMDDTSCVVDVAKYFMDFCKSESCGNCVPCRVGTAQMHAILEKVSCGDATEADLDRLEELCELVKGTSLCGLGQSAPNPVLSTLRYFRSEYLAHIEGRCPAGVCKIKAKPAARDATEHQEVFA